MSQTSIIPSLQSDALAREIERQFSHENAAIAANAERDSKTVVAQAHVSARAQMRQAIAELRKEGARRLTRAQARMDTEVRERAHKQAARAVHDGLPLLREALQRLWLNPASRKPWIEVVAHHCVNRLPAGAWNVAHPPDWSEAEQKQFAEIVTVDSKLTFETNSDIAAGLRISADQAVLDATPQGLLADPTVIAALLLDELGAAS